MSQFDTGRWRGVAYYKCINCKKTGAPDSFHIIPIHHDKTDAVKLDVCCHSCYLYFTDNEREELVD